MKRKKILKRFVHWTVAYLILHNIFLGYKDSWEEEDNGGNNIAAVNQDPVPHATGFYLRLRMQDYLLT